MDQASNKSILEGKIKKIDGRIAHLSALRNDLTTKLNVLSSLHQSTTITIPSKKFTPDEKVILFKSYFHGRNDVYAKLWINNRTGKRGYSPVCKHEWNKKLCRKPAIKCSECPNQQFSFMDENVFRQHLLGDLVIGLYPMLKNETCYFLAIDFDKENWFEDIISLKTTCDEESIPAVIERSRSGLGGHLWIFFDGEVPAITARKLGSYLITKTMNKRYQMEMKSYDRLFPNQDTLPKGGFGNLIALPFQKEAVRNGNTVFIDHDGKPYSDQWTLLASTRKMNLIEIQNIVNAGIKSDIINVRQSPIDENDAPWMQLPSNKHNFKTEIADLPKNISAVLTNRIYIKADKLPSALLNQLKHLAAFQNPEFYKKQKMRFSTYATPRVICCSDIANGYLSLPRGCLDDVKILLKEYNVELAIQDKRFDGQKCDFPFLGTLNDEQNKALENILSVDFGMLVAPPGSGKTIIALSAIAKRKSNALILVHRKPLMDQWRIQIMSFLGINKKDIGQIGGGKDKPNGIIDVAMIQSLDHNSEEVDGRIANYGFVIVDECHHVGAFSFEKILSQVNARYVLGLTATPYRRDGHQPIIHMQCGPVSYQIKQKKLPNYLSKPSVVVRESAFTFEWNDSSKIHQLWLSLVTNEQRNQMIVADVITALEEGRFPLILTERREHLEKLSVLLKDKVDFIALLHGGLRKKATEEIAEKLKESSNIRRIILATGSYIGEGFDEPRLDTLFLTMPSSFKGKIVQYAGRLHRYHKDKKEIMIYDYVDKNVVVLEKMFRKRVKTYKMLGYSVIGE